jgi:hypothetical protein
MAAAALMVVATALFVALVAALPSAAGPVTGQGPPGTDPTTTEPTPTTAPPPTTPPPTTAPPPPPTTTPPPTTVRPTTTTAAPRTTTTQPPPTTVEETTTTVEETTTTTGAPASLVPPVNDTVPPRDAATGATGLSDTARLGLVVGGLIAIGALIATLTYLYWRHTRPQRYLSALDALAEVDRSVVPAAATAVTPAVVGGAARAGDGDGAGQLTDPTAKAAPVVPGPVAPETPPRVEPAAPGPFRILGPVGDEPSADVAPGSPAPDPPTTATDPPAAESWLSPAAPVIESPPPIVTAEELFGKKPAERPEPGSDVGTAPMDLWGTDPGEGRG